MNYTIFFAILNLILISSHTLLIRITGTHYLIFNTYQIQIKTRYFVTARLFDQVTETKNRYPMALLPTGKLSGLQDSLIHQDTQQHRLHTDLTVAEITKITSAGSLDFGGSEFEPAEAGLIQPEKKNPDDKYGWWNLDPGTYRAQFNEKAVLPEYKLGVLLPHEHTDQAGLIMNSRLIFHNESDSEELQTTFHVPASGTAIKENARIASLFILE